MGRELTHGTVSTAKIRLLSFHSCCLSPSPPLALSATRFNNVQVTVRFLFSSSLASFFGIQWRRAFCEERLCGETIKSLRWARHTLRVPAMRTARSSCACVLAGCVALFSPLPPRATPHGLVSFSSQCFETFRRDNNDDNEYIITWRSRTTSRRKKKSVLCVFQFGSLCSRSVSFRVVHVIIHGARWARRGEANE